MLTCRLFQPTESDILYHYCSASTFQAILESGRVRFTDINMLNDAQEMQWGYSVFEEAASKLIQVASQKPRLRKLDKEFFDKVDQIIAPLQGRFHPFVSCFSRTPDLPGQWHAYADEGHGFAIGFAAKALKQMPVSMLAVEYGRDAQVQEMMDALGACFLENEADENKFGKKFFENCVMIGAFMIAFKNPAFREEQEGRCLHVVTPERTDNAGRLVDHGGIVGGVEGVQGESVRFRIRDNALTAYLDMPFRRGFGKTAIKRIMFGPANPNRPGSILYFAGSLGYEGITLGRPRPE